MTNRELQEKLKEKEAEILTKNQMVKDLIEKHDILVIANDELVEKNKILSELAEKQVSIEQPKSIVKKHIVQSKHITLNK